MKNHDQHPKVVIIGGGFAGLNAARHLKNKALQVTFIDKRNFHLFQPLLYQVATGSVSPGDITYPLRGVVAAAKNIQVQAAEVVDIQPDNRRVILRDGELSYDYLILATGAINHFYGHKDWENSALDLKTIEDALNIRRQILLVFEAAERETDPERQRAWLHFVIVGGGPTGVELAGAIAELARDTLKGEFRRIDPARTKITLLEGTDRILGEFAPMLTDKAVRALQNKGVTVRTNTFFQGMTDGVVKIKDAMSGKEELFPAGTILWAAGIKASPLGEVVARRMGAELDRMGRLVVNPDLSLPGYPEVLVAGDLAHFAHQDGKPLPGVAQVAIQQGGYAARLILAREEGRSLPPFKYTDKGSMAVIGRNSAIASIAGLHLSGFIGWLIWAFIHISFLIGFDNKLRVMIEWAWYYFTGKRGARLITGKDPYPLIVEPGNAVDEELQSKKFTENSPEDQSVEKTGEINKTDV